MMMMMMMMMMMNKFTNKNIKIHPYCRNMNAI